MYKQFLICTAMLVSVSSAMAQTANEFVWYNGEKAVAYNVQTEVEPVVKVALDMFSNDMSAVTGKNAVQQKKGTLRIVELDKANKKILKGLSQNGVPVEKLMSSYDGFHISVIDNQVVIVGKNGRGTAYGILEMSRMAGVNPWIWWGDVVPPSTRSSSPSAPPARR